MIRLFTFFLLAVLSFPGWGAIVYEEDWDSGPLDYSLSNVSDAESKPLNISGGCYFKPAYSYNNAELSTNYKRNGAKSLRIEVHNSEDQQICPLQSDRTQGLNGGFRTEMEFAASGRSWNGLWEVGSAVSTGAGYVTRNEEIWWGTSYYIPSNEGTNNGNWWGIPSGKYFFIGQLFAMEHSATPEIETLITQGGNVKVQYSYSTNPTTEIKSTKSSSTTITTDTWHDFIYHWKRSIDGTGILEVWHNGVKFLNYTGPAAIWDKPHAIIKAGAYGYSSTIGAGKVIVLYIDAHVIGDANSSYAEIQNAMSGTAPSLIPKPPTSLTVGIQP